MNPLFLDDMSWEMAEVYAAVTDRIMINLAKYFPFINAGSEPRDLFEYQAKMLAQMGKVNRETVQIIAQSLAGEDEALRNCLEAAIRNALKTEEPKLRTAAEKGMIEGTGFLPPEVSPNQMQAFQMYYQQSADKLNLVNTVMLESTQQAYAATVSDIVNRMQRSQSILNIGTGEVVSGVSSWNEALNHSVDKMIENGLTGFVDHGGHRWKPETYVAMDIRTTVYNTAREAVFERQEQYGSDLYQVSSHAGARPLCYPWQGKVISRTDNVRTVTDLDGNEVQVFAQSQTSYGEPAGLFGINCKHYPMSFIPGISRLRGEPQNPEENEKSYKESQQQRALERDLREKRRDLEVLKARNAPEEEIAKQKAKVDDADQKIRDFCDETGRARRRSREQTPVDATWPDPETGQSVRQFKGRYEPVNPETSVAPVNPIPDAPPVVPEIPPVVETPAPVDVPRPAGEQEVLQQFNVYDPSSKTDAQKLAQINPNYSTGEKEWTYNCQRTVTAQELVYRGYNVTAKAYNPNDPIKTTMWNAWEIPKDPRKDPYFVDIVSRDKLEETVKGAFDQWGDGSRAAIRLKRGRNHGNFGHFIFARRSGDEIIYSDGQKDLFLDIKEELETCTTGKNQMWIMRLDNRKVNENIIYAVQNVED